jgi:hypothetical protein
MVGVETPDEPATTTQSGDISVRTSLSVLPNHFWIGVNGTKTPVGA